MKNAGTPSPPTARESSPPPAGGARSVLDWAREQGEADRVMRDLDACLRRRRTRAIALGASLTVCIALAWPLGRMLQRAPTAQAATAVVLQPERRVLPDGSVVELDAGAEIATDFSGPLRRVTLRRGEAHFQVVKDPQRPFVVTARGVDVRAVGTAFAVELGATAVEVVVTEGRVAVEPRSPESAASPLPPLPASAAVQSTFGAGKRIVVEHAAEEAKPASLAVADLSAQELAELLAWRVPRLEFSGTPLAQALPLFRLPGPGRLLLADPALGRLQLSGVLRADNIEALLRLLEGEFGLSAEKRGDDLMLHRR